MDAGDTALFAALVVAAAFVAALTGFGFALLTVPPLAIAVGPKDAVVLSTLIGTVSLLILFLQEHRHVRWRTAAVLTVSAFVGTPLGLLVLELASARVLQGVIGANVLLATIALWRGWRLRWRGDVVDGAAGFISGVLNTSTGMNGPPVVLALQARGFEPLPFRATIVAFFVAANLFAVALFAAAGRVGGEELGMSAVAIPGLLVGLAGGRAAFDRLPAARFRGVVLLVLSASAVVVLARALV